ncbi:hypothetical protein Pst134EA_011104 [Puccinia striiformis f. sp. tritici]|uniref:hypothetical protein n=1 Tax=Puccinia striiformis f. sp. tritici TaxID=168172 RepID=UPI00200791EA|nr:hypothetical protein Pst134EA_011104 [Puccinia striiformis f. sp. tritici]KAH9467460.1 hypothetical protein Pst134EA_011104 [Puccinia striiformis f. sp. tritici]
MRLISKQQISPPTTLLEGPVVHPSSQLGNESSTIRPRPSDQSSPSHTLPANLGPTSSNSTAGLVHHQHLPPILPYPQLPASFSSPGPSSITAGPKKTRSIDLTAKLSYLSLTGASRPSPHLLPLPKASISNPIIKPVSAPQEPPAPPLLANRTNSDSFPLSHLTYLPANYAQKFKASHKPVTLEIVSLGYSPSYNPMKPSGHETKASVDTTRREGRGLQPAGTAAIQPAENQQAAAVEKSTISFFKRPIRIMRDKKGPPNPLVVNADPSSIKTNENIKPTPLSPGSNRPSRTPNHKAHSDNISKLMNETSSLPMMQKGPSSSSTGSKLNSLLNAAARSIRTGDSRLFESFHHALSPRLAPESDKTLPNPIQSWDLNQNSTYSANSLKRIPVPRYNISEVINPSPLSSRPVRATSFDRPKTATKHSRTASMPYSQAPFALQHATPLHHPRISQQQDAEDETETVEKLSVEDEKAGQVANFAKEGPTQIAGESNVNIQVQPTLRVEVESNPLEISSYSLESSQLAPAGGDPLSPTPELSLTGARAQRSSSTLSYEDFREMVSRAMGSPLTVNHTITHRNSCLSPSNSISRQAVDVTHERAPDRSSVAKPVIDTQQITGGFLQRNSSVQEEKRKSFQNMPLPALPNPSSTVSARSQQPTGPGNIKKQPRPWTMSVPGSFGDCEVLKRLQPTFGTPLHDHQEEKFVKDANLQHAPVTSSTLETSLPPRRIRHSYPLRLTPNPSPLEQVSNGRSFPHPVGQTGSGRPLLFKFETSGEIGYRQNRSSRLTPCLTTPCTNLMFGFRGEVYEVDKCEKPSDIRQSVKASFDYDQEYAVKSLLDYRTSNPKLSEAFDQDDADLLPTIDLELDEMSQSIELKEICLIGSDHVDDVQDNLAANNQSQDLITQKISIERPSPRLSQRTCSAEHVLENLSIDRGSSEEDSFRLSDESKGFELGSEPKIINPETSLEMAASILGQPVPAVSKEIWKGFERIHSMSEGRFLESDGKEGLDILARLFEPGTRHNATSTNEAAVQTDPVAFTQRNDHFSLQPPFIIRRSSTRRVADALKKLANKTDQPDSYSKENLPLIPTPSRHSFQSEGFCASPSRAGYSSLQDFVKADQRDTPRTPGMNKQPWSERRHDMSELRRFNTARPAVHSIHVSHYSPLRQNTSVESNRSLRCHSPLTTSPILTETVLDALDNTLRAEETFQREKIHLQSIARRQSQTIENLLLDKEVLSLEVARLTGLVELLTRDHNLLNERIDKAEEAFEKIPCSASLKNTCNQSTLSTSQSPDNQTASTAETSTDNCKAQNETEKEEKSGLSNGILTETDDGMMGGDSEYFEEEVEVEDDGDEEDDDRDSLCDPEQGSMIHNHVIFNSPRYPFVNGISSSNTITSTNNHANKNHQSSPITIPAPYPLLPTVPAV